MSASLTIVGNLAADPELRFTASGKAVVNFTVMTSTSRKTESGAWENTDVTGWPVAAFDRLAENIMEAFRKGDGVIVVGKAANRSWEKSDGSKGNRMEITAWDVAASLKRTTLTLHRLERQTVDAPINDPWTTTPTEIPPF